MRIRSVGDAPAVFVASIKAFPLLASVIIEDIYAPLSSPATVDKNIFDSVPITVEPEFLTTRGVVLFPEDVFINVPLPLKVAAPPDEMLSEFVKLPPTGRV
jgi:hypothetical protein